MKPILEIKNLNYIYSAGTPFEHQALKNITLSVDRGEFVGIIGHTGSGKSTLMQQMNGLLKPIWKLTTALSHRMIFREQ